MKNKTTKRRKNKIYTGLFTLILIGVSALTFVFAVNAHVKSSVNDSIVTADEASLLNADCILILGAGVWANERPAHMLRDRLLKGIELYDEGVSDRLLMSGDHGRKEYDEVNVMKQYAIDKGIVSEHIFMDHAGFSTYESLYRTKHIFKANKIIIVTQEYHIYRALYIAEKLGITAYGVTSDSIQYAGQDYRELREKLARSKDFLSVIIKPEPKYLGDTIPISGNGDVTND